LYGCRKSDPSIPDIEGVAYDREEHDRGIISIAAPILTDNGQVVGALSIATSTSRFSLEDLDAFRPQLLETRTTTMAGVVMKNVIKKYGDVQVIHGIDLEIADGEFCVFVGPSGCGKSTLLRMVAGLEETTGGEMHIGRI